ncbi:inositol monophosphatase family protein [Prochlorothrix hollandica]|uniref:3'-5'-bisphosphate nucleotidase n=1 Tax=Prochlorothrix hollandica PCC 9006 = CALU 1027 TaxID=317619 RepID=A0A0M2PZM8_PROHO|nr:inositol monophosphatase family protein [Prochlorothrix hollandica]KKJ00159.1 3'-5'-bisphosphate nucleotidase [Prochlorothrix hollandica PCC 9006 = CALU 1027]
MSHPTLPYAQERAVALHCAITAGHLCEAVRRDQASAAFSKPDHSPVTIADYAAQALICRSLQQHFPQDPVMGEEDARLLASPAMAECLRQVTQYLQPYVHDSPITPGVGSPLAPLQALTPEPAEVSVKAVLDWVGHGKSGLGDRFWTLDPIDGTKGYVRGDQYAVALALIEKGQLQVAVIVAPALAVVPQDPRGDRGVAFVAVRGQGAQAIALGSGATQPLRVNGPERAAQFRLIESVERDHGTPAWQQAVAQAIGLQADPLPMDSLAKYGAIARGEADLYMRLPSGASAQRRENIWDHGAGVLVLEEAGGRVTDQWGQPLDFSQGTKLLNNEGIVASNGVLHAAAIAAIQTLV